MNRPSNRLHIFNRRGKRNITARLAIAVVVDAVAEFRCLRIDGRIGIIAVVLADAVPVPVGIRFAWGDDTVAVIIDPVTRLSGSRVPQGVGVIAIPVADLESVPVPVHLAPGADEIVHEPDAAPELVMSFLLARRKGQDLLTGTAAGGRAGTPVQAKAPARALTLRGLRVKDDIAVHEREPVGVQPFGGHGQLGE